MKKISGEGHCPSPDPTPVGEGAHPPPQTSPPLAAYGGSARPLCGLDCPWPPLGKFLNTPLSVVFTDFTQ